MYNEKRRFHYSKLKKTNHKDKTTVPKDRIGPRNSTKYRHSGGQQGKQKQGQRYQQPKAQNICSKNYQHYSRQSFLKISRKDLYLLTNLKLKESSL
jgi:hypothetical protein